MTTCPSHLKEMGQTEKTRKLVAIFYFPTIYQSSDEG